MLLIAIMIIVNCTLVYNLSHLKFKAITAVVFASTFTMMLINALPVPKSF